MGLGWYYRIDLRAGRFGGPGPAHSYPGRSKCCSEAYAAQEYLAPLQPPIPLLGVIGQAGGCGPRVGAAVSRAQRGPAGLLLSIVCSRVPYVR